MTNSECRQEGMTVLDAFAPEDDVITILNRAFAVLRGQLVEVTADRDEAWATIERLMHGAAS